MPQRVNRTDHAGGPTGYFLTDATTAQEKTQEKISKRASLLATATQVLGVKLEDLEKVTSRGIVERVVGYAFPKILDVEGKSDDFLEGLFLLASKGVTYNRDSAAEPASPDRAHMVRTLEAAGIRCDGKHPAYVEAAYAKLNEPTTPRRPTRTDAALPSTRDDEDAAEHDVRADAHARFLDSRRTGGAETQPRADADPRATAHADFLSDRRSASTPLRTDSVDLGGDESDRDDDPRANAHTNFMKGAR